MVVAMDKINAMQANSGKKAGGKKAEKTKKKAKK